MKRVLDVVTAIAALGLLSPLLLLISLAVCLDVGRPILFVQKRPGLRGSPFRMRKFRTMRDDVDPQGRLLPDAARLTRFGRFLRHTSLDELPGLFNVLAGDMSLVGPRPLLSEYLPLYNKRQARRHEVRPGLTGWAQVNGRNALSWDEKLEMDVWYVDNRTFGLDLRILARTVVRVLAQQGVSQAGHATAEPFRGTPNEA